MADSDTHSAFRLKNKSYDVFIALIFIVVCHKSFYPRDRLCIRHLVKAVILARLCSPAL